MSETQVDERDWTPPADWPVHFYFGGDFFTCDEWGNPESIVDDPTAVTCVKCLEWMHA